MRRFIIVGHTQKPTLPVRLDDPAGEGRWDVLTRCVAMSFLISNGIRRDVEVLLVLASAKPPRSIRLRGDALQRLHPDERSILGLVTSALAAKPVGKHAETASPGVELSAWTLADVLEDASRKGPLFWLHESGKPLGEIAGAEDLTFVLSDHVDLSPDEERLVEDLGAHRISLGPRSLHAASCIAIVHHVLDSRSS